MASPKILFEISVLGYAAQSAMYRTGVFRMVDEWARRLAACPDADIAFGSTLDARTALRSHRYWAHSVLHQRNFVPDATGMGAVSALDAWWLERSRLSQASLFSKIPRRAVGELLALWDRSWSHATLPKDLDVFHATYWPFPQRARSGNTRYLMTFADLINVVNPALSTDGGAFFRLILDSVKKDDFTVSISEATRRDLLTVRPDLDPNRSHVAYLAAGDQFRTASDSALLAKQLQKWKLRSQSYFLSVCTLERRKNIAMLIDAFEAWATRTHNEKLNLVLTGASGDAMDSIGARLSASPVKNRVQLLGFVPDSDLPALYQGCTAFVYPSLQEGFGLPVLEALQCGARVVTAKNSSLTEVGGDAVTYCDAHDRDSLIEAMQQASDGRDASLWREKALHQASKFSWDKSVKKLQSIYQTMS